MSNAESRRRNCDDELPKGPIFPFHLSLLDRDIGRARHKLRFNLLTASHTKEGLAEQWIRQGRMDETLYFMAAAKQLDIPFVAAPPHDMLASLPHDWPLKKSGQLHWILTKPFARLDTLPPSPDSLMLCAPHGVELDRLKQRLEHNPALKPRMRMTTPTALNRAIRASGSQTAMQQWVFRLKSTFPVLSAHQKFGAQEALGLIAALAILMIGCLFFSVVTIVLNGASIFLFVTMSLFRLMTLVRLPATREPAARKLVDLLKLAGDNRATAEWPSYSVLVPLYREGKIIPDLVKALGRLDYPRERLKCYLLIEADDRETRAALERCKLPPFIEMVDIPHGAPRTKPRALNFALSFIESDITVIYDAEDRPDPQQLKIAALHMMSSDEGLACVQGRLAIDNAGVNFITQQFSIEYSALFDGLLPFLASRHLVVPLGGTSNHFRTRVLRQIGAWDPFNVTEDADLGLRLSRFGYRIEILRSDTWEEAPETYNAWLKQRTRWFKGWMQTWLVHMRQPMQLYQELGRQRFLSFQIMIGSMLVSTLVHPLYIVTFAVTMAAILFDTGTDSPLFWTMFFANGINLLLGYGGSMALGYYWSKRRYGFRLSSILGMPLYWLMMTPAAWRALYQLMRNPHHWEKTEHGASKARPPVG